MPESHQRVRALVPAAASWASRARTMSAASCGPLGAAEIESSARDRPRPHVHVGVPQAGDQEPALGVDGLLALVAVELGRDLSDGAVGDADVDGRIRGSVRRCSPGRSTGTSRTRRSRNDPTSASVLGGPAALLTRDARHPGEHPLRLLRPGGEDRLAHLHARVLPAEEAAVVHDRQHGALVR